jgi:hypothetical protein
VYPQQSRIIGSRAGWAWVRLCQLLSYPFIISFVYSDVRHSGLNGLNIVLAAALVLFTVMVHPNAYVHADATGISFRRYFRRYFVRWEDVQQLDYRPLWSAHRPPGLTILLSSPIGGTQRVELGTNPTMKQIFRELVHGETPEFVTWMREQMLQAKMRRDWTLH